MQGLIAWWNKCCRSWHVLSLLLLSMVSGCSAPLLPPAYVSESERAELPDAKLISLLKQDWLLLGNKRLDEKTRAEVLARYNHHAYLLICRYRADIQSAIKEQRPNVIPLGVTFKQDGFPSHLRFRDVYEDVVPAQDVEIEALQDHFTEPGLGVPLVGVIPAGKEDKLNKHHYAIASRGTVQALTMVVEFPNASDNQVCIRLIPRNRQSEFKVGGVTYPLAADISATIEVYWNLTRVKEDRMLGMLRPQELRDTSGLSSIDSYNPKKIPVILTHGLLSSAGTFDN